MTHRHYRAAMAAVLFGLACGGDSTGPRVTPTTITTTTSPTGTTLIGSSAGTFAVKVTDASAAPLSGVVVTFAATGSGSVSPTVDTTDVNGLAQTQVTASSTPGTLTVTATVSGSALRADASVTVLPQPSPAPCAAPAVGAVSSYQNFTSLCFNAPAGGADYTLIAYNTDTGATLSTSISASGVATPPAANLISPSLSLTARGAASGAGALVPDLEFHARLRSQAQRLTSLVPAARAWQRTTIMSGAGTSSTLSPSGASHSSIPSNPKVGDLLSVNVDVKGDCTTKDFRTVRVEAIGTRSIVMADTANPSGGFTTADYQRFSARFDTLVFPLDSAAFGAPTDIDKNGKVGILFTRAVNEYTSANSSSYVAGFFADRDLFPRVATSRLEACATSNETEMFYMLAPDPNGTINGNVRATALISGFTTGTIAHEFQHLINAGRRLYVNTGADFPETTWLNEGLSHIAEELLYYRESGRAPRQNLTDANIRLESPENYQFWKDQQSQNFSRFSSYLSNPASSSPRGVDNNDDQLSTRGATWSFLRYSADRLATSDGQIWFRMVNSLGTGLGTLREGFGTDPLPLLRDYTVANYLDDLGINGEAQYQHLSWNYRDIFTKTFTAGVYPLKVTGLASGASVQVSVRRNSAGYYRLAIPANGQAVINLTTAGATPPVALQFLAIRTR
jgi:hypothetical protein